MNIECENTEYCNMSARSKNCYLIGGNIHNEDCCYGHIVWRSKDCFDCLYIYDGELCYQCVDTLESYKVHYGINVENCSNGKFLINCTGCQDCFGCVGLKSKKYCIFNKQYAQEQYEDLVRKIIEKMQAAGQWGDFFPIEFSSFGYNESIVNEYFPLTKEQALAKGYSWRDEQQTTYSGPVYQTKSIDTYKDRKDQEEILSGILQCKVSGKPFRIIRKELDFYMKMGLPLPNKHFDIRHKERMALKNPRKLWSRKCDKCEKDIQTTYSPQRPEKVFCETCYKKEVY